jgi:hypothetical protein
MQEQLPSKRTQHGLREESFNLYTTRFLPLVEMIKK